MNGACMDPRLAPSYQLIPAEAPMSQHSSDRSTELFFGSAAVRTVICTSGALAGACSGAATGALAGFTVAGPGGAAVGYLAGFGAGLGAGFWGGLEGGRRMIRAAPEQLE